MSETNTPEPKEPKMSASFIQVIGILVIVNTLIVCVWWSAFAGGNAKVVVPLCLIGMMAGFALTIHDRITEFTLKDVGTIKAAAKQATNDAAEIAELKKRIEGQSATVDLVAKAAGEAKQLSENLEKKTAQADAKLTNIDASIKRAEQSLSHLEDATSFNNLVIAASNDDRKAFDKLREISETPSSTYQKFAERAYVTILDKNRAQIYTSMPLPWKPGFNPADLSLGALRGFFHSAKLPEIRAGLIEYMHTRADIPKQERMAFYVAAMKADPSLKVVEWAGRFFQMESRDSFLPLATEAHLEWWEKNKNTLPTMGK